MFRNVPLTDADLKSLEELLFNAQAWRGYTVPCL